MNKRRTRRGRGRPTGTSIDSRAAILAAARELFAARGLRGTTTRAIAKRVGVDVALLRYFFVSKLELFAAAIDVPALAEPLHRLLAQGGDRPGEQAARLHLEELFEQHEEAITAMLRAALGDPASVPALRQVIEEGIVRGAARALPGPDARLRTELAGAWIVGLFICRHMVKVEPLASASVERVVRHVGPPLDALLAGRRRKRR
jgi:AcrR family transcriptional regulator